MPKVRPNGAQKWVDRAGVAGPAYEAGVKNPRRNWSKATADASENFKTAIQKAIAEDRFKKGVIKAGDEAWLKGAIEKGVSRYPVGVAVAKDKYQNAIAPFLSTIEAVSLPPKFPKGDPRNYERVKAIGEALHAKKVSMQ